MPANGPDQSLHKATNKAALVTVSTLPAAPTASHDGITRASMPSPTQPPPSSSASSAQHSLGDRSIRRGAAPDPSMRHITVDRDSSTRHLVADPSIRHVSSGDPSIRHISSGDASVRRGSAFLSQSSQPLSSSDSSGHPLRRHLLEPSGSATALASMAEGKPAAAAKTPKMRRTNTITAGSKLRASKTQLQDAGVHVDPWVIMPLDPRYIWWWSITVVCCYTTAFYVAFMFGFANIPFAIPSNSNVFSSILSWTLLAIFTVDSVINSLLAYYDEERQVHVTELRQIQKRYFRFLFWVDLIAVVPFDSIVAASYGELNSDSSLALYIALLKWLDMARLYRLYSFFQYLETNTSFSHVLVTLIRNGSYILIVTHWAACIFYWIARQEFFSDDSWVGQSMYWLQTTSTAGRYIFSMYWSMTTIATVGYGDIHAYTVPEAVFVTCYMFLNIFFFAYVLGTMTLMVVKGDEQTKLFRENMHRLKLYSERNSIPKDLKGQMTEHLELHFWNVDATSDETLLGIYPSSLRRRVLRHLYLQQLQECELLANCMPEFLDAILSAARIEVFMPKVDILAIGDHVNELFIIVSGTARSSRRTAVEPSVLSHGLPSTDTLSSASLQKADSAALPATSLYNTTRMESLAAPSSSAHLTSPCNPEHSAHSFLTPSVVTSLSVGNSFGDVPFFTDGICVESVQSVSAVRVLAISRDAYDGLAGHFLQDARLVLKNLQHITEQKLLAELEWQDQSSIDEAVLTQLYQLAYTGEEITDSCLPMGLDLGRMSRQTLSDLLRLRYIVSSNVSKTDKQLTHTWLAAATLGDCERIREMLMQGHSVDSMDYDGRTALMLACAHGHKTLVTLLMQAGADASMADTTGRTSVLEACWHGHDGVLGVLMEYGATINIPKSQMAGYACNAVFEGDMKLLGRLLRAGVPPDVCDYDQRTALHIAASVGNLNAVRVLLTFHANPGVLDRWGNTPLDDARRVAAAHVIKELELALAATSTPDGGAASITAGAGSSTRS